MEELFIKSVMTKIKEIVKEATSERTVRDICMEQGIDKEVMEEAERIFNNKYIDKNIRESKLIKSIETTTETTQRDLLLKELNKLQIYRPNSDIVTFAYMGISLLELETHVKFYRDTIKEEQNNK